MKTLESKLTGYIKSTRKAAAGNMKMSVAPKGQICSEKHKVVLRNISMEQTRTADELQRLLDSAKAGQGLQDKVVRAVKAWRYAEGGELAADALNKSLDALIAFEAEHKIGE
jgi:uncharacterized protein YeaC (DUF1315 family)